VCSLTPEAGLRAPHEHLQALVIIGAVLDASVLPGLSASQFPSLRKLFLQQVSEHLEPAGLVRSLRSLEAPSLADIYVIGLPIFAFLTAWGSAELPWNLCLVDYDFDDIEGLLEVLDGNDALRTGKLRLDLGFMPFPHEIEELLKRGVTMMVDTIKLQAHWSS
jgi:hypothetical protein